MRPIKPGKKPASRSSAQRKRRGEDRDGGVPTWLRLDLLPDDQVLSGLRDCGRLVLTSGYLGDADRTVIEHVVQELRSAEPQLFGLLTKIGDPALARELLHRIAAVAKAAYVVGAHGAMTDTARVFFERSHATRLDTRATLR